MDWSRARRRWMKTINCWEPGGGGECQDWWWSVLRSEVWCLHGRLSRSWCRNGRNGCNVQSSQWPHRNNICIEGLHEDGMQDIIILSGCGRGEAVLSSGAVVVIIATSNFSIVLGNGNWLRSRQGWPARDSTVNKRSLIRTGGNNWRNWKIRDKSGDTQSFRGSQGHNTHLEIVFFF